MMWDNSGVHMSGSFQSRHSRAPRFNKINWMTEVKLMIRELTLLFSVGGVRGNWSLLRYSHLSAARRSGLSERLSLDMSSSFFFSHWYQTWWKDAPLMLGLVWDAAVDSRLHRNWRHLERCWYSYYQALWFGCDLFWKMGSCRKHECIPEGLKPTIFWCQTAS